MIKYMRKICFIACWMLCLFSCGEKKEVVSLDQVPTQEVHLKKLNLEDAPLLPKGCCMVDSLLIIYEPNDKEGFLSVYKDTMLLGRYGTLGDGPDDFFNPRFVSNGAFISGSREIRLADINALYTLNVDSALIASIGKSRLPQTIFPEDVRYFNYVLRDTDSLLLVQRTSDFQLTFYDKISGQVSGKNYFDRISSLDGAPDICYVAQVYDAYYTSNGQNIVIAYKNRKLIDILSLSGDLQRRIYFPGYDSNDSKMSLKYQNLEMSESALLFFTFAAYAGNSYYFLCWEATRADIRVGKARSKIYKMDMSGNVEAILRLDKCISYFCLDESRLYAIGLSEGEDLQVYCADLHSM